MKLSVNTSLQRASNCTLGRCHHICSNIILWGVAQGLDVSSGQCLSKQFELSNVKVDQDILGMPMTFKFRGATFTNNSGLNIFLFLPLKKVHLVKDDLPMTFYFGELPSLLILVGWTFTKSLLFKDFAIVCKIVNNCWYGRNVCN